MAVDQHKRDDVAAAIVAFRPEPALIVALAAAAARETDCVLVFANSALEAGLGEKLRATGAALIEAPLNLGVAEAFNICALEALLRGKARVLLLDQDSEIRPGFVNGLSRLMDDLIAAGAAPGVVGPRIFSPPEGRYKAPRYFPRASAPAPPGLAPVQYVISSGSLVSLSAFRRVGPFRSDFFIDAVDTEWCFRAWAKGGSCWVARDVMMVHRIGEGALRGIGAKVPRQPDFRLYALARNQTYCLTLPHMPLLWKARFGLHITRVILASWAARGFRLSFVAAMARAVKEGWAGKLGPPPGASGAATLEL